jgi:hypothetical protein
MSDDLMKRAATADKQQYVVHGANHMSMYDGAAYIDEAIPSLCRSSSASLEKPPEWTMVRSARSLAHLWAQLNWPSLRAGKPSMYPMQATAGKHLPERSYQGDVAGPGPAH